MPLLEIRALSIRSHGRQVIIQFADFMLIITILIFHNNSFEIFSPSLSIIADLNCIVATTAKSGAFIWDIDKVKMIRRFTEVRFYLHYCMILDINV